MPHLLLALALTTLAVLTALAAAAQERSRTILVLDASGSMWGQIDGTAKIAIAQQVIGDLLRSLPEDQLLGLTVYGARRKGDCTDIETLVQPTGDRAAIAEMVSRIKPRGKTPMTDAVIAAAEALKYTEERATVILVSDGIETCNPDPCAAARVLEENGVDFTAHVIGFAVSDETALAQMQCLAEETGGLFRTAANAGELAQTLQEVAEPEPAPERSQSLPPGKARVEVMRLADGARAEEAFSIDGADMTVTLVLPPLLPAASLEAPDSAPAGSQIEVTWSGPGGEDFITIAEPGVHPTQRATAAYTADSAGHVLRLDVPTKPGSYELRYVQASNPDRILTSRPFVVEPVSASLAFDSPAPAGGTLRVTWEGPGADADFIGIAEPGSSPNLRVTFTYIAHSEGNVVEVDVPTRPGSYELRYVQSGNQRRTLASAPLEVIP